MPTFVRANLQTCTRDAGICVFAQGSPQFVYLALGWQHSCSTVISRIPYPSQAVPLFLFLGLHALIRNTEIPRRENTPPPEVTRPLTRPSQILFLTTSGPALNLKQPFITLNPSPETLNPKP